MKRHNIVQVFPDPIFRRVWINGVEIFVFKLEAQTPPGGLTTCKFEICADIFQILMEPRMSKKSKKPAPKPPKKLPPKPKSKAAKPKAKRLPPYFDRMVSDENYTKRKSAVVETAVDPATGDIGVTRYDDGSLKP